MGSNAESVSVSWRHLVLCAVYNISLFRTRYIKTRLYYIIMTSSWARWCIKSQASQLFTQPFVQVQIKENIKSPRHWPLCGEITGAVNYPHKGQVRQKKWFHLMTSSWRICALRAVTIGQHFLLFLFGVHAIQDANIYQNFACYSTQRLFNLQN